MDGEEFLLMSGNCLLCLVKVEPDVDGRLLPLERQTSGSFQCLAHYLRLDMGKIFSAKNKFEMKRSELKKVSLCEGCALLSEKVWELYEQLERIKLEMASCLTMVRGKIQGAEESGLVELFRKSTEMMFHLKNEDDQGKRGKNTLNIVEALRKEIKEKCSRQLSTFPPQVQLDDNPTLILQNAALEIQEEEELNFNLDQDYRPSHPPLELVNCGDDNDDDNLDERSTSSGAAGPSASLPARNQKCPICEKPFRTTRMLNKHIRTVHRKNKLKENNCPQCEKSFTLRYNLRRHLKLVHQEELLDVPADEDEKSSSTNNIEYSTFTIISLLDPNFKEPEAGGPPPEAIPDPETGKYKCPLCPKEFAEQPNFVSHHNGSHLQLRYKCNLCDNGVFTFRNEYRHHHRMAHLNIRFTCERCGRPFKKKSSLMEHQQRNVNCQEDQVRNARSSSFPCPECGNGCRTEEQLQTHLRRIHLKIREFVCDQCGKEFTTSRNLGKHVTEVHSRKNVSVCEHCGKEFYRKDSLTRHLRGVHKISSECKI